MSDRAALLRRTLPALVTISLTLGGCGSTGSEPSAGGDRGELDADQVAARYGYVVEGAEYTPAYALVPAFGDPVLGYARSLLIQQCMAGVYDMQLVPPTAETESAGFKLRSHDRVLTVDLASQWGYRPPPALSPAPQTVIVDKSLTEDQIIAKQDSCAQPVIDRLGEPPESFLTGIVGAGWDAADVDEAVSAAETAWGSCMGVAGVIDLPETPIEMPPPSVASGASSGSSASPSQREKEVAVMDVACRESSGYEQAHVAARARGELTAIGKDIEGFEAARDANATYAAKAQEVINEYG